MASSEKNRYFDLRKMSFLKKKILGTISRQSQTYDFSEEAILPFREAEWTPWMFCRSNTDAIFFRPRKEKKHGPEHVERWRRSYSNKCRCDSSLEHFRRDHQVPDHPRDHRRRRGQRGSARGPQRHLGDRRQLQRYLHRIGARCAERECLERCYRPGDRSRDIKGSGVGN